MIVSDEITEQEKKYILMLQQENVHNLCQFCNTRNIEQGKSAKIPIYRSDGYFKTLPAYRTFHIKVEQCSVCYQQNLKKSNENELIYFFRLMILILIFPFKVVFEFFITFVAFLITLPINLIVGLFKGNIIGGIVKSFSSFQLVSIFFKDFFAKKVDYLIYKNHPIFSILNQNWKIGTPEGSK